MQGHLFFNQDSGSGGLFGHIDQRQKWCVKCASGLSYHIESRLHGLTEGAYEHERPKRQTVVTVCDGSCQHANKIPDEIWNEAKAQFSTFQQSGDASSLLQSDVTNEQLDSIHLTGGYQGA